MSTVKKPDQMKDELTGVIYPPGEAVVNQLTTIRAIIPSTIKMYETTKDIHTIFPNLDMIQRAIDYLKGAPALDLEPKPEIDIDEPKIEASDDFYTTIEVNDKGEYNVSILGIDVEPITQFNIKVAEINLSIKSKSNNAYIITEHNPYLSNVPNELLIDSNNGEWVKETNYIVGEDDIMYYNFFLLEGRTRVRIVFESLDKPPIVFNIKSHIHFKEQEVKE